MEQGFPRGVPGIDVPTNIVVFCQSYANSADKEQAILQEDPPPETITISNTECWEYT
jgi:hypothetical protein